MVADFVGDWMRRFERAVVGGAMVTLEFGASSDRDLGNRIAAKFAERSDCGCGERGRRAAECQAVTSRVSWKSTHDPNRLGHRAVASVASRNGQPMERGATSI